jgi:hypothetical protein
MGGLYRLFRGVSMKVGDLALLVLSGGEITDNMLVILGDFDSTNKLCYSLKYNMRTKLPTRSLKAVKKCP